MSNETAIKQSPMINPSYYCFILAALIFIHLIVALSDLRAQIAVIIEQNKRLAVVAERLDQNSCSEPDEETESEPEVTEL